MEVAEVTVYKVMWGLLRTETIVDDWESVWLAAGWYKTPEEARRAWNTHYY